MPAIVVAGRAVLLDGAELRVVRDALLSRRSAGGPLSFVERAVARAVAEATGAEAAAGVSRGNRVLDRRRFAGGPSEWISVAKAAERLGGISVQRVRRLCVDQRLMARRGQRGWEIEPGSVADYAAQREQRRAA